MAEVCTAFHEEADFLIGRHHALESICGIEEKVFPFSVGSDISLFDVAFGIEGLILEARCQREGAGSSERCNYKLI